MRPLSFHHIGEVVLPQIKGFISYREPKAVFFCSWRQGGAGACRTGPGDGDISTQRLMGCPSLPWACWLFVGVLGSEPGRPLLLRTVGSFNPLRPRVFSNPLFPSVGVAPSLAARPSRRPTNRRPDLRITWSARGGRPLAVAACSSGGDTGAFFGRPAIYSVSRLIYSVPRLCCEKYF